MISISKLRQGGRLAGALLLALLLPAAAWAQSSAQTTARDLQVVARALGFLETPLRGNIEVAVVHPPGSPAEAQAVIDALGPDGLRAGNVILRAKPVPSDQLAAMAANPAILLIAAVLPQAGPIANATAGRGVVTIATEERAASTGQVVMTVRSEPRVEIIVNRAAAQAAGVRFAAAFRMMIQER